MEPIRFESRLAKANRKLGLVFGWGIVCRERTDLSKSFTDYVDRQDHHISEPVMLDAAVDFALNSRIAKDMHKGDEIGPVVFIFPMTEEIAKAYEFDVPKTGMMVAVRPGDAVLAQFENGERTGFSIGGTGTLEERA